jgi:hypothetical protein
VTSGPRPFVLVRDEDDSGVSGMSVVAQGVELNDGTVELRWLTQFPMCTVFYDRGIGAIEAIGPTRIVFTHDDIVGAPPTTTAATDPRPYRLILAADAPTITGVSKWTVLSWVKREQLFSWGIDAQGHALYRVDHIEALRDRKPRRGSPVRLTSGNR